MAPPCTGISICTAGNHPEEKLQSWTPGSMTNTHTEVKKHLFGTLKINVPNINTPF